jgi:hypothetical protein
MPEELTCPRCHGEVSIPEDLDGDLRCPNCTVLLAEFGPQRLKPKLLVLVFAFAATSSLVALAFMVLA